MPLSLAGITLGPVSARLIEEVERNIDQDEACPWTRRAYLGPRLAPLPSPTGFRQFPTRAKVNTFAWPRGASNFAYGWFIASAAETNAIRSVAFGGGSSTTSVKLAMSAQGIASNETGLSTNVWCMPPVPLGRVAIGGGSYANGLYVIPVVDQRYWWWQVLTPAFSVDGTTTTWASLFPLIATALGITAGITVDTIPTDYRLPDIGLNLTGEVIPPVFDAIAACIGMRVVVDYNGNVSVFGTGAALKRRQNDDSVFPLRTLIGGGDLFSSSL